MVYVALLRGINVGGKNKVEMARLKQVFERLGCRTVKTYINSGNVIFKDNRTPAELVPRIEQGIEDEFGFAVKVVLRDLKNIEAVNRALPAAWTNDITTKCDVMFLWETFDSPAILQQILIKPQIDEVKYAPGAILWCVQRPNVTRSGMMKLAGSELYKHMTIRNCNTVRKLYQLMREV